MTTGSDSRRMGRWILVALFALFFAPLLIAMAWYALAPGYAPPPSPNGELIDPPRPLEAFSARSADGATVDLESLRGRWQLVHVIPGACGGACRERLYHTRQVHDALGEDRVRVVRLAVVEGGAAALAGVLDRHPRLRVLPAAEAVGLVRQLPGGKGSGSVFVVDPLGNLMMRFPPSLAPDAMLDDLEKLLKLSRIG